jgi:hypothetical protein
VAFVQLVVFPQPRRHRLFQVESHGNRVADVEPKRNAEEPDNKKPQTSHGRLRLPG